MKVPAPGYLCNFKLTVFVTWKSIICFVTIGGKPEFAEPAAQFGRTFRTKECDDAYFAAFLMKEYGRIISQVRWYGRVMSFKTIAAVEFQTVGLSIPMPEP